MECYLMHMSGGEAHAEHLSDCGLQACLLAVTVKVGDEPEHPSVCTPAQTRLEWDV